jgi:hypothetical protein
MQKQHKYNSGYIAVHKHANDASYFLFYFVIIIKNYC